MKVLYQWMKEFVPLEIGPEEAAATLSRIGFEVSAVQNFGGKLQNVVTAEVRTCGKHPNADRLSLCTVFDGQQELQVVCGASNVKAGIKVAFARVGAQLPDGTVLKAAKLRGVDSNGMICSAAELGLEEKSDGILVLDPQTPVGQDIRPILGLDDTLIEIEVTPNRRDTLSIVGVARELAAALSLPMKMPEPRTRQVELTQGVTVVNEAPELCPRYMARLLKEVRIGPAPDWMVRRLNRCGIRSINNVVDITNYVMLELGQPLHAFDAGKIEGRQIRIRRAKPGETLLTLEGKTAVLNESTLVIADAERPAALAGIMGGQDSAIDNRTHDVILESAAFQPNAVRKASKALGVASESSYRFERGTDWNMVAFASLRASQLIQDLAGGISHKPVEYAAVRSQPTPIKLRTDRMKRFLGVDIKESVSADILRRLGCVISTGTSQMAVAVPSWRLDLTHEADLMEEIARLFGYDNIPLRTPNIHLTSVPDDELWTFERRLLTQLAGLGFLEACNYSLVSRKQVEAFTPGFGQQNDARPIALANPLSQEQAVLRTSMLPALLQNALLNFRHQTAGVRLSEAGRVFFEDHNGRHEWRRVGLLIGGESQAPHWRQKRKKADFFDLSGSLETLASMLHIPSIQWMPYSSRIFHPRRSSLLMSGSHVLGWMGEIHPDLLQELDTPEPLVAAELDLAALEMASRSVVIYKRASPFPPVHRDLSVTAPVEVPYEKISKTVRGAAGQTLESVSLIDLYHGATIGEGRKSLTLSLSFRLMDRTLQDAEVEKLMSKIVGDLEKKCGATLRT